MLRTVCMTALGLGAASPVLAHEATSALAGVMVHVPGPEHAHAPGPLAWAIGLVLVAGAARLIWGLARRR